MRPASVRVSAILRRLARSRWRGPAIVAAVVLVVSVVWAVALVTASSHNNSAPRPRAIAPAGCSASEVQALTDAFTPILNHLSTLGYQAAPGASPAVAWYPDARACQLTAGVVNYRTGDDLSFVNAQIEWDGNQRVMTCLPPTASIAVQATVMGQLITEVTDGNVLASWAKPGAPVGPVAVVTVTNRNTSYRVSCSQG